MCIVSFGIAISFALNGAYLNGYEWKSLVRELRRVISCSGTAPLSD